jgi:hypothetical protein
MYESRKVFSQNGHRLVHKQTLPGLDAYGFAGDSLNPYGTTFNAHQYGLTGFANPYPNFGVKMDNDGERRNKNGDYLDMFVDEYNAMWQPINDNMGEFASPGWNTDLGAFDSLMPLSMQARQPQMVFANENRDFNTPLNKSPIKQQKNHQSRLVQQRNSMEMKQMDESDSENNFKLSQQISVNSLDSDRQHRTKKKKGRAHETPHPNFPDPNFLITMILIDPNFDLGAFMQNYSQGHKHGGQAKADFIESLEALNPETKFNLRAIFMEQNHALRKIETEIKLIRDEKERDDKNLVLDKVRGIEKELNRREKSKKFDQFKDELFTVI